MLNSLRLKKITINKVAVCILALLACMFIVTLSESQAAPPVLLFSDLSSGPKTGWEGSATKGVAVTVWGRNFGTTRGNSYITVNGAQITEYAEWGTTGHDNGIPTGLQRTTFWLNNNCQDGSGTITVSVNSINSNSLPFTVRSGNIYFISVNGGSDTYNGKYASAQGGSSGPWKTAKMALHSNNSVITIGDTIYFKAGTYTEQDQDGAIMRRRGDYGTQSNPIGIIGYPGEMPVIDMNGISGTKRGIISTEICTYTASCGTNLGHGADYFTISKLKAMHGGGMIGVWGRGNRIIGNYLQDNLDDAWTGVIMVDTSEDTHIYGNYFQNNGFDAYKHNIYIKTHKNSAIGNMTQAINTYVGWNEFDSWKTSIDPNEQCRGGMIEIQTESDAASLGKYTGYVYVHDNYMHDGESEALYIAGPLNNIYVYNNILENIQCPGTSSDGVDIRNNLSDVYIYNNVFYHIGTMDYPMIGLYNTGSSINTSIFKNNIFVARNSGQPYVSPSGSYINYYSDFDLYYGGGNLPSGSWAHLTNQINQDPLFVNPSSHDFRLQASSPAIDKGTSDVSSIVSRDFYFNPRPMDGDNSGSAEYDIGAHEYNGTYIDYIRPSYPRNAQAHQN